MMTATRVEEIPPISRDEARELAATELERYTDQLAVLDAADWARPTECDGWDVRAMAGHSVGMMTDFSSYGALVRRMVSATRAARAAGGPMIDSMTAQQVAANAGLTTSELVDRARTDGPRAVAWRFKAPRLLRRLSTKQEVDGELESWRNGYLLETILTRDPWMHRVDIARATGRDLVLTPDHDGRIVADVVAEWARRHGQPFRLTLTGPAGGEFVSGHAGDHLSIDAVELCRTLSGRSPGEGLLAQQVPF